MEHLKILLIAQLIDVPPNPRINTDMTTLRVIWRFRGREKSTRTSYRGLAENSRSTHTVFTEDSQRTHRGLAGDSQRSRRELTEDSQRTHRGLTEGSQRTHTKDSLRFAEDLPSGAVLNTGFNEILPA